MDIIDGKRVPPLVIDADHTIDGEHRGTLQVTAGELLVRGEQHGTVAVLTGARVRVLGSIHGTVSVASDASVAVLGAVHGTVSVSAGGTVVVEASGRLAGTLRNDGDVIVRGVFGGKESGSNPVQLEGKGCIKQPTIRNGAHFYEW